MALTPVKIIQRYLFPGFLKSIYFYFKYGCLVSPKARVQFTKKIIFNKGTVVKPFAIIQTGNGKIIIGRNCAISSFNHLSTSEGDLILGDFVRIGPHVTILGSGSNYRKKNVRIIDQGYDHKGIQIGNDVLIGAGAVILSGCKIGNGAVIGAGSIVTKDVLPYSVVVGNPAKIISERD